MRVSIQPSALADLRNGFRFYERHARGMGGYFLDTLYYEVKDETSYVRAVLDLRRDPAWIVRKLQRLG